MADNMRSWLEKTYGKYYGNSVANFLAKADDPINSTEAGYSNVVYGARAYVNILYSKNTFSILPKDIYGGDNPDGMRLMYATGTLSTGIQEGAALPDTDKPDVLEATVGLKEELTTIEISNKTFLKARANDYVDVDWILKNTAELHAAGMNGHLNTDGDTLAGYNLESVDRMTASAAYATADSWTAGDADFNGVDVSTYTWYDANTDHNSGTDRTWSMGYFFAMNGLIRGNNGNPNMAITNTDAYGQMMASAQTQMRFSPQGEFRYVVTEEGAKPTNGGDVGFPIASIDGVPVFTDPDVQKDSIGRVYIMDTNPQWGVPQVSLNIAQPTIITSANNWVLLDYVKEKTAYYTSGELRCRSRFRQGSIRDLKASSL